MRLIVDDAGDEVASFTHNEFGIEESSTGTRTDLDFMTFVGGLGMRKDPTGLYYARQRYYDASLGRWLSADPIGFKGGLNLYAYCSGDPISRSDPSGLLPEELPGSYAERQARWAAENPQQARQQMLMVEGGIQMFPGGGWVVQAIDFAAGDWEWSPPVHGTPRAPLSGGAGGSGPSRPSQSSIEIQNGRPVLVRGNKQGPLVVRPRTTGRTQDARGIGVEVTAPDGSYLEISGARVKAGVPNTHPRAPAGTIQKVHWPNPFPTDPAKRLPTTGELDFLRETHGL